MNKPVNISAWLRMFRMKRKSSSYEPRMIGFPFIFIIAAWIMLWFIWPHGEPVVPRPGKTVAPRVSFIGNYISAYSNPVYSVVKPVATDEDIAKPLPWMVARPVKLLEKNEAAGGKSAAENMKDELRDAAVRDMNAYVPVWQDKAVFSNVNGSTMHLTVEPAGALAEYGFQAPDLSSLPAKMDKPWLVSVFVRVDEKGKIEHVFLESGCENREINSTIVRSMYRGRVAKIGKMIEGRVRVNFGQD